MTTNARHTSGSAWEDPSSSVDRLRTIAENLNIAVRLVFGATTRSHPNSFEKLVEPAYLRGQGRSPRLSWILFFANSSLTANLMLTRQHLTAISPFSCWFFLPKWRSALSSPQHTHVLALRPSRGYESPIPINSHQRLTPLLRGVCPIHPLTLKIQVFMTRRDILESIHEPFGDAFYFGPEFLSDRFRDDVATRQSSGYAEKTYKDILDSITEAEKEVRH